MRVFRWLPAVALMALSLAVGVGEVLAGPKDKKDPDWLEFDVYRDGQDAGTFGFKTVTAPSGTLYTSTKLEVEGKGGGKLSIQTLVERHPSGRLEKYKKWIGIARADPSVIAFWYKDKLRVVSKGKPKFTKDLVMAEGFGILDAYGFHQFFELAALWKAKGITSVPVAVMHKGEQRTATLAPVGMALLKDPKGAEVKATRLHVRTRGFDVEVFLGERPMFLGFRSSHLTMWKKGWSLIKGDLPLEGEVEEPDPVESVPEKAPDAESAQPQAAPEKTEVVEPPAETPAEETPAPTPPRQKLPELP